jgi:hypothetical protein
MRSQSNKLSKSRLVSARQCMKRLYLEVYEPQLAKWAPQTRAALAAGRRVGDIARRLYDQPGSVLIPYAGGMWHAIRKTTRLLDAGADFPIFEGTLAFGGVLVRFDVLLPAVDGWHVVEVKSATSPKDEHMMDCAIQSWVLRSLGYCQRGISLAHVNKQFVYPGDGDYRGLLTEVDVADAVDKLLPGVPEWVRVAGDALRGAEPTIPVGAQCNTPYECPFIGYCWPAGPHPVQKLPRASKAKLGRWIAAGFTDLRQVPAEQLSESQLRVRRVVQSGIPELLPGAREFATGLGYPRYYLDFETIAPAVPIWAGTRPYEVLPVQWSCHYEASAGKVTHADFLDLSGDSPLRRLAESLIRVLGHDGPVLTYTGYERQVIAGLRQRFSDLAGALAAILDRLVDLHPVTQRNYYHPAMAGSWSLKSVLPTISAELDYKEIDGIQEGTAASEGYLEAIDPATSEVRRAELREQLLRYCRHDTAAMLRLVEYFAAG